MGGSLWTSVVVVRAFILARRPKPTDFCGKGREGEPYAKADGDVDEGKGEE